MGQYYIAVSLDAKQAVHPFGAKLMEHSWIGNSYMKRVEMLLSPSGSWHKTRIVWAGDYMDDGIFLEEGMGEPDEDNDNLYMYAAHKFPDASASQTDGPEIKYIVNHTKRVYIDLSEVPPLSDSDEPSWQIHPLSILTSSGNGRGGGDYIDDSDANVGTWAGDVISTEYVEPRDMEKFKDFFTQD